MTRLASSDFAAWLAGAAPSIDLRAPVEFAAGSIPGAVNLPLLTDAERHEIGVIYKTRGQDSAVARGHDLVSGDVRAARLNAWQAHIAKHPDTILFCFRGGLRSQIVQRWLAEIGVNRPIVTGGYKALRQFLLESLERIVSESRFVVVAGPTGSGKTEYLKRSGQPFVDLEALAKHRGSAFGALDAPQPSQVDFENALAQALLRLETTKSEILIESESRLIGRCCLPPVLHQKIKSSPRLVLNVSLEARVENIFRDYILDSKLGTRGDKTQFDDFRRSLTSIARKLGGLRVREILDDLDRAETTFAATGDLQPNRDWIRKLLVWYYDPRYAYGQTDSFQSGPETR